MVGVALVAGSLGGAGENWILMNRMSVQGQVPSGEVIRAARFEVMGKDGKTRALLGEPDEGFLRSAMMSDLTTPEEKKVLEKEPIVPRSGLFLIDEKGNLRAGLETLLTGEPDLSFFNASGYISRISAYDIALGGPKAGGSIDLLSGIAGLSGPHLSLVIPDGRSVYLDAGKESPDSAFSGPSLNLYALRGDYPKGSVSLAFGEGGPSLDLRGRDGGIASLDADATGSSLFLQAKEEEKPTEMSDSIHLTVSSPEEKKRIKAYMSGELGPSLSLSTKRGTASLSVDEGPSLTLSDRPKTPGPYRTRATLGVVQLKDQRTGEVAIRPPSSLVLFGENGKTIWQAP